MKCTQIELWSQFAIIEQAAGLSPSSLNWTLSNGQFEADHCSNDLSTISFINQIWLNYWCSMTVHRLIALSTQFVVAHTRTGLNCSVQLWRSSSGYSRAERLWPLARVQTDFGTNFLWMSAEQFKAGGNHKLSIIIDNYELSSLTAAREQLVNYFLIRNSALCRRGLALSDDLLIFFKFCSNFLFALHSSSLQWLATSSTPYLLVICV